MDRRFFLRAVGAGALGSAFQGQRVVPSLDGVDRGARSAWALDSARKELTLTAAVGTAETGIGETEAWVLNGSLPGPTLRMARGEPVRILLRNQLPEPTILHWHGFDVPEASDGHPRLAIDPGDSYAYSFTVHERAGLYWYHPHPHQRTAAQTYMGLAGLLVVEDDEERSLQLPRDDAELTLVLQDKRLGEDGAFSYEPRMGPDRMLGYLGDRALVNGRVGAEYDVPRGPCRLRMLNASNARIFELELGSRVPMTLIGADGGLLPSAAPIDRIMMGTGERVDVIADFGDLRPGEVVALRSRTFEVMGMMGMMGGRMGGGRMGGMMSALPQGAEMELARLRVGEERTESPPLPDRLSELAPFEEGSESVKRTFRLQSRMMQHTINGRSFDMERVDVRVPLARPERWSLVNESELPHPIHLHAGQFHVLSRTGGRARIMPWEVGLKDTVLVLPGEQVDIGVHFRRYPGLFLLHCHNLEHEDMGMMANVLVEEG